MLRSNVFLITTLALLTGCSIVRWRAPAQLPDLPVAQALEDTDALHVDAILTDGTRVKGRLLQVQYPEFLVHARGRTQRVQMDDVQALRLGDRDKVASDTLRVGATVVGTVLVVAALAGAVALVVVIATKTSCPFVYIEMPDGSRVLIGEGYSGAVGGALQRHDWLALGDVDPGPLSIVLANEAREVHYTDLAELWLVQAPPGARVRTTPQGAIALGAPQPATAAVNLEGVDQSDALAAGRWETDLDAVSMRDDPPQREGLVLSFDAPGASEMALELHGGNTMWSDLVAGRTWAAFTTKGLSRAMERFEDPNRTARHERWRAAAGFSLQVEVDQGDGWHTVTDLAPLGWVAPRDMALPLTGLDPNRPVDVRVSGGTGFWWFGDVALAPIVDADPQVHVVSATSASGPSPDDQALLAASDGEYQVLPSQDTEVRVDFDVPDIPGATAMLHLDGYYTIDPPIGQAPNKRVLARVGLSPRQVPVEGVALYRRFRDRLLASAETPIVVSQ